MLVVCLIAVECGVIRLLLDARFLLAMPIVVLSMVDLLILTAPRLRRRNRPYWIGFQAVGWGATVIVVVLATMAEDFFLGPVRSITENILERLPFEYRQTNADTGIALMTLVTVYIMPLILLSMLGGWIAARWARRRAAAPIEVAGVP